VIRRAASAAPPAISAPNAATRSQSDTVLSASGTTRRAAATAEGVPVRLRSASRSIRRGDGVAGSTARARPDRCSAARGGRAARPTVSRLRLGDAALLWLRLPRALASPGRATGGAAVSAATRVARAVGVVTVGLAAAGAARDSLASASTPGFPDVGSARSTDGTGAAAGIGSGAAGAAGSTATGGVGCEAAAGSGAGCAVAGGGAGATGGGAAAGGAAGAGGGLGALRGGSKPSGSTYVSPSPNRMPRWTYGVPCSVSPDGPASATGSPSPTDSPFRTRSAPTCVSEALYPSVVTIVTVRPCVGTWPANDTSPEAGARTVDAPPRAMSTPRC
jgi:hypothetical protein